MHSQFEGFLKQKFAFVADMEEFLKNKFREIDNTEEHNTFFELYIDKIINDISFNIINYEDFNTIDNQGKTVQLIQDMKLIIENNITNSQTNDQAIKNIDIIRDFYTDLKVDAAKILESLAFTEEKFNMKTSPQKL